MKKFVYQVNGYEFTDTVAFGDAWREAKAMALELNAPLFRMVINGDKIRYERYGWKGGCFLNANSPLFQD